MDNPRLVHGNVIPMGIPWETSHGMGWVGTDKYVPWTTLRIGSLKHLKNPAVLKYFLSFRIFEQLAPALNTEFALN